MATRRGMATGLEWLPYWTKLMEVAWAAPQVMALRLAGMSTGRPPTARQRREQTRMVQEKADAFVESMVVAWSAWPRLVATMFEQSLVPVHSRVVANNRRLSRR